jgi:hypothetical protein
MNRIEQSRDALGLDRVRGVFDDNVRHLLVVRDRLSLSRQHLST